MNRLPARVMVSLKTGLYSINRIITLCSLVLLPIMGVSQFQEAKAYIPDSLAVSDSPNNKSVTYQSRTATEADSTSYEYEAYESSRSFAEHLLALPSYLLHWSTRPLGWGVKYVEENYPYWFKGERAPYGIYPLFELGDEVIGEAGVLLYHNNIGRGHHESRIEATAGLDGYRELNVDYMVPASGAANDWEKVHFEFNYEDDPKESLFYNGGGNNRRTYYTFERFLSNITYNIELGQRHRWSVLAGYRNTDIGVSDKRNTDEDFEFVAFPTDSTGRSSLGSIGTRFSFDFTRGAKRTIAGSRYIGGINLNRSLTSVSPHFLTYHFEWQQFVPVPLLPDNRRLALRSRLDKAVLLEGDELPFYELPDLGSGGDLRGVRSHRFRDNGALLFTLEYRYPVWGFADAVIFWDKGQVFNEYENVDWLNWRNSYGFGFHLLSGNNFAFRSEFAFSKEYSRIILSISPNF